MKLYREVKVSERLPDKLKDSDLSDVVFTIDKEGYYDADSYDYDRKDWENHIVFKGHYDSPVESWLEPIEITEEDIRKQSEEYEHEQSLGIAEDYANEDFIAGVNWVLSKLKGE